MLCNLLCHSGAPLTGTRAKQAAVDFLKQQLEINDEQPIPLDNMYQRFCERFPHAVRQDVATNPKELLQVHVHGIKNFPTWKWIKLSGTSHWLFTIPIPFTFEKIFFRLAKYFLCNIQCVYVLTSKLFLRTIGHSYSSNESSNTPLNFCYFALTP